MPPNAALLMGALVADAASLGLHWLYDPERIARIAQAHGGQSAFTAIDPKNYADVKGYFAHGARRDGQLTQYGEAFALAMRSIRCNAGFDSAIYSADYVGFFGAGGPYRGYIDRPTKGALANIAAEITPSGIDDDQLPALATLPAVFAATKPGLERREALKAARQVTNVNAVAEAYAAVCAALLEALEQGTSLQDALTACAQDADPLCADALQAALATSETDSTIFAGVTGRACHLPMAIPLAFHILKHAVSYTDAVERNIRAGGDSAGRSILIGAIMGRIHGIGTERGIPLAWLLALEDGAALWQDCLAVAG